MIKVFLVFFENRVKTVYCGRELKRDQGGGGQVLECMHAWCCYLLRQKKKSRNEARHLGDSVG